MHKEELPRFSSKGLISQTKAAVPAGKAFKDDKTNGQAAKEYEWETRNCHSCLVSLIIYLLNCL